MAERSLAKSAILMALIVVVSLIARETYLRSQGLSIAYDDGPPLWSDKRAMVYEPSEKTVVFIGSSRIKYDLDIPTWQQMTGCHAVQLSIEGSSPRPVLQHLADDPNFKGRLVVDVTEGLFFSGRGGSDHQPNKNIAYYDDRTPAQHASFWLNGLLESQLVLLDKENHSLNAELDALQIPSRPGVFMMPIFPVDFQQNTFDRQMYMTERFLSDTSLQHRVSGIWAFFAKMGAKAPPMPATELDSIFLSVKTATDRIRARGGEVFFVRTPSSGPALMGESMGFPRERFWERLLQETGCPGLHFADYPAMAAMVCPEDSHLSPQDAVVFTRHFVQALAHEKGWKFPNPIPR